MKFSNFMSQDWAFDTHFRFPGRALYKMIVLGRVLELCLRGLFWEEVAVTDDINSHITRSYFDDVDPDEIILDEEDLNDPFIHVNMKDIRTYSKGNLQQ